MLDVRSTCFGRVLVLAGSLGPFAMSLTVLPGILEARWISRSTGTLPCVDAAVESALTGIAREAITNAVKHSNATRIAVELDFAKGGAVRVVVSDDGIGFDPDAMRTDSYGLVSTQERATRGHVALTFVTEPGAGTTIVASWSPENVGLAPSSAS